MIIKRAIILLKIFAPGIGCAYYLHHAKTSHRTGMLIITEVPGNIQNLNSRLQRNHIVIYQRHVYRP